MDLGPNQALKQRISELQTARSRLGLQCMRGTGKNYKTHFQQINVYVSENPMWAAETVGLILHIRVWQF